MKTHLGPAQVHIVAHSKEARARGQRYVATARAMLMHMVNGKADGVTITGQTRTLPDGTTIKVGMSDNDVSMLNWIQIVVPDVPAPESETPELASEIEESAYIWIGMRQLSVDWECGGGPDYPLCLMLNVWEPSPDGEKTPAVISRWPLWTNPEDTALPALDSPFRRPNSPITEDLFRSEHGTYFVWRLGEPLIKSPVTTEEDVDDLWHEVCVMDPADADWYNDDATRVNAPASAESMATWGAEARDDTYLLPDDPEFPEDVDIENWPIERHEPIRAKVLPLSGDGDPNYYAKVFFEEHKCTEVRNARGRLKIITGKGRHQTIDRYEFVIANSSHHMRAMLPGGYRKTETNGPLGDAIPPGPNVMDGAWSTETWKIGPIGGSEIVEDLPWGLNPGSFRKQPCAMYRKIPVSFAGSVWTDPIQGDGDDCATNPIIGCFRPGRVAYKWEMKARAIEHTPNVTAEVIYRLVRRWLSVSRFCGEPLWSIEEIDAAIPRSAMFYIAGPGDPPDFPSQPFGFLRRDGVGVLWKEPGEWAINRTGDGSPECPFCGGEPGDINNYHWSFWAPYFPKNMILYPALGVAPQGQSTLVCYFFYDPFLNVFEEVSPHTARDTPRINEDPGNMFNYDDYTLEPDIILPRWPS